MNAQSAEDDALKVTIDDIAMHGPYYAYFCQQYTPAAYNHEI